GIGVPSDKLRLIFEAFQQADGTTSREYGGTGLGLSVSREIARVLGGEIAVRSTVGEGSIFTLYLPLVCPVPVRSEAAAPVDADRDEGAAIPALAVESDPPLLLVNELGDDRRALQPGDHALLVIESDP